MFIDFNIKVIKILQTTINAVLDLLLCLLESENEAAQLSSVLLQGPYHMELSEYLGFGI